MHSSVRLVRLGDYIERSMVNNLKLVYGAELIQGVNSNGEFCISKAKTDSVNLKPYKIVQNGDFVYNPSRLNIGSLAYRTNGMCIVSHLYVVFRLNEKGREFIIPEFLLLFFKRDEFLRLVTYLNYGSQRPEFNFYDMSDIKIPLPQIDEQKKLVAVWKGLRDMKEENEQISEPLQTLCRSYLQELKHKYPLTAIGELISEYNVRNSNNSVKIVKGISVKKQFRDPNAKVNKNELRGYKIVPPMHIAYVQTTHNEKVFTFDLNRYGYDIVVSSVDRIIYSINNNILNIEYLDLWFRMPEFDRYARFNSWGSAREIFSYNDLCRVKIPLPPIEIQEAVVEMFRCADESRKIASDANELSSEICPVLMQKVIRG